MKTYSSWCPFKGLFNDTTLMLIQSGRTVPLSPLKVMICTCLVANLILSHHLKRLFDKPFLCAVFSKGLMFIDKNSLKSFIATKIEYDDVMLIYKLLKNPSINWTTVEDEIEKHCDSQKLCFQFLRKEWKLTMFSMFRWFEHGKKKHQEKDYFIRSVFWLYVKCTVH